MLSYEVRESNERSFIASVAAVTDPHAALAKFAAQYHYFSIHQIHAFLGIFKHFDPTDRQELSVLSHVACEELGKGNANRVHSVLLESFAKAVGLPDDSIPIPAEEVVPGVREYIQELYDGFQHGSRATALATYCFLETSAVKTYPLIQQLLNDIKLEVSAREFFDLHATLEIEHAMEANTLAERHVRTEEEHTEFREQFEALNVAWGQFWNDLKVHCAS